MCGIIATIGSALHPEASYELMKNLLVKTESRGEDATGFWACQEGISEPVIFTKSPTKSSVFVNENKIWQDLKYRKIDLLIGHCRKKTTSGGHEKQNKNNHPFISDDHRTALVHNGVIQEYYELKKEKEYNVISDCDSEILLRMTESGESYPEEYVRKEIGKTLPKDEPLQDWVYKLMGLRDIFARCNNGAMAVEIGECNDDGSRTLWLFRDKDRPLHVIDQQETLGQIFICSTLNIWREAVEATPEVKKLIKPDHSIIEFPAMYIWKLDMDPEHKFSFKKWKVNRTRRYNTTWEKERPNRITIPIREPIPIITDLDIDNDYEPKRPKTTVPVKAITKKEEDVLTFPPSTNKNYTETSKQLAVVQEITNNAQKIRSENVTHNDCEPNDDLSLNGQSKKKRIPCPQ